MRKIVLSMAAFFVLAGVSQVMAGNFWIGKIPEPGSSSGIKAFSNSQFSQASEEIKNQRNGDPCGLLDKWGLVLDEWKDGNAEHNLTPAEIIVLATEENDGNVVAMLTGTEIAQRLIDIGQSWNGDFEYRLLESMGYGANQADRCRWYGNVPNYIGTSYQYALEESSGLTFQEAFLKFTDNQGDWQAFRTIYARYAWFINQHLGLDTTYSSVPSSSGYYHDFAVTPLNREKYIEVVQLLFEAAGSTLADKDLFRKSGTPSVINYDAPEKFCQCQ